MTGLIYILTAVSVALVVLLGRKSGHEVRSTSEIFRYDLGLLKIFFFCSFIPLLVNVLLIIFGSPKPSDIEMLLQMCFALLLTAALLFWQFSLKRFSVEIGENSFAITKMRKETTSIAFSNVKRINLLQGGRGEHVLSVLGKDNQELVRFSESIQDFDSLTELFKSRAKVMGIPFFYRDCHDNWSQ
jgi:hypothetical protein